MRTPTDAFRHGHLTDADIATIVYAGLQPTIALVDNARQSHLETCDICRTRVDEARRLDAGAAQLLHVLDLPMPRLEIAEVIGRARQRPRWSAQSLGRYAAVAASFLVCVLGVVAFALPTSSLGRALQHLAGMDRTALQATASTRAQSGSAPQQASGIALHATGPLTIEFRGGMPPSLHVRYCDTSLATLHVVPRQTPTDPGTRPDNNRVRFTVSTNRIRVATTDVWDDFVLTLPEQTPMAYVTDADSHATIAIGPPPSDHVSHGCHAPVTVPLSH